MSFSKTQKIFVFLLGLLMILSIANASYPVNSFATETDKANESELKIPLDTEDVDITYPAVLLHEGDSHENKENKGVFMGHRAHMPKFKETKIPTIFPANSTSIQEAPGIVKFSLVPKLVIL